jgi:hypothetical protein
MWDRLDWDQHQAVKTIMQLRFRLEANYFVIIQTTFIFLSRCSHFGVSRGVCTYVCSPFTVFYAFPNSGSGTSGVIECLGVG